MQGRDIADDRPRQAYRRALGPANALTAKEPRLVCEDRRKTSRTPDGLKQMGREGRRHHGWVIPAVTIIVILSSLEDRAPQSEEKTAKDSRLSHLPNTPMLLSFR